MKNKKHTKPQKITIFFIVTTILFMGLSIYFGLNQKSHEDIEKINLHEHLLNLYVQSTYGGEGKVCESVDNGLSKDGDVYIRFWCQDYNEDHKPITEQKYHTLYFQHYGEAVDRYNGPYAEALGD